MGSLEDLWAFNTPEVADAIFQSQIPIISAVGHETDTTIADFVADARAATPTAGAELATPNTQLDLLEHLLALQTQLIDHITSHVNRAQDRITATVDSYGFRSLGDRLRNQQQSVDRLEGDLQRFVQMGLTSRQQTLETLSTQLRSLHPLSPMQRGFALLRRNGDYVEGTDTLMPGDEVEIVRQDQTVTAEIKKDFGPQS